MSSEPALTREPEKIDMSGHVHVKLKQDFTEYDNEGKKHVQFIRVEINNTKPAIESIIEAVADMSWMGNLVDEALRRSFTACAAPTVEKLKVDLKNAIDDKTTKEVGEYIVSMVARHVVEAEFGYKKLPLAELIKEKISGNPGFDFHHEKESIIILFGEAKYLSRGNAYTSAFKQIVEHIASEKDMKEMPSLRDFITDESKANMLIGKRGYTAAFSTSGAEFNTEMLISNIKGNTNFEKLVVNEALLIVAVDING